MVGQPGFFDLSDRYAALSAAGDPLERLASVYPSGGGRLARVGSERSLACSF